MLSLSDVSRVCDANFYSNADDTWLYISVEPKEQNALSSLTFCLSAIKNKMNNIFLWLKEKKKIGLKAKEMHYPRILDLWLPRSNQIKSYFKSVSLNLN